MDKELYHYGVKGMKWGIRRTPEQLGRKASPKHRDLVGRNQYTKARVERSKIRLTNKYNKRLAKEESRYAKSNKDDLAKDRLSVARETYRSSMQNLNRNSKINAGARDVGRWTLSSVAKSTLVPVGGAAVSAMLAAGTGAVGMPALIAALSGGAAVGSMGATVSNVYRGYQTVRNVMGIANAPDPRKS